VTWQKSLPENNKSTCTAKNHLDNLWALSISLPSSGPGRTTMVASHDRSVPRFTPPPLVSLAVNYTQMISHR